MLSVDAWDEDRDTLGRFVAEKGLVQRVVLRGRAVHGTYGLVSIPANVWIDRAGVVRDVELGFEGAASLERKTKRLLAGNY